MADLSHTWLGPPSSSSSTENIQALVPQSVVTGAGAKKKQQQQQPRQLLSCTKCRERKVKCDRTKPCSACCARGQPKECHFVVTQGGDYGPIQQSYELRKLRAENLRLKERLRAGKMSLSDDEDEECLQNAAFPPRSGSIPKASTKAANAKQRKFKGQDPADSLYFGSPGLANIVNDFANLSVGQQSLSHGMPRAADIYAPVDDAPAYPFATLWPAHPVSCIPALLGCLPPKDELYEYLDAFQRRAQSCSFPHTPEEITRKEIDRFLADAQSNAEMYPDMLALIFAALAQGAQNGVFDKSGGKWVEGGMETEASRGDVYIAAAMQALRTASFMNRPTLLGIQTLIMIGPYLTNSGRFLDAWVLFGTTIRLAHSVGLHRNPKYLDPAPPLKECGIRQALWWWMLHMDQQYSMTLGRPLGISGIGDCPPPEPLTTNPTIIRLTEYVNQFTVLARQILCSDRLTNAKIDDFTDRLRALWDTMPEILQFDQTWLEESKEIPEWPLDAMAAVFYGKLQNYLILLNRQRHSTPGPLPYSGTSVTNVSTPLNLTPPSASTLMPPPLGPQDSTNSTATATPRGRACVISSSISLLNAFLYFYRRVPAALICWTMGQQAFNAAMILLLDALETGSMAHVGRVEQAFAIFVELEKKGVHKLAGLAVNKVSRGLEKLRRRELEGQQLEQAVGVTDTNATVAGAESGVRPFNYFGVDPGATATAPPDIDDIAVDTVMGNTGMLLLEDLGLQSFVPESFAPLSWDMAGSYLAARSQNPPAASAASRDHKVQAEKPQSQPQQPVEAVGHSHSHRLPGHHHDRYPTAPPYPHPHIPQLAPPSQFQPHHHPHPHAYQDRLDLHAGSEYLPAAFPIQLDLHNTSAMNLGGNPGWAARPAPVVPTAWPEWEHEQEMYGQGQRL